MILWFLCLYLLIGVLVSMRDLFCRCVDGDEPLSTLQSIGFILGWPAPLYRSLVPRRRKK